MNKLVEIADQPKGEEEHGQGSHEEQRHDLPRRELRGGAFCLCPPTPSGLERPRAPPHVVPVKVGGEAEGKRRGRTRRDNPHHQMEERDRVRYDPAHDQHAP